MVVCASLFTHRCHVYLEANMLNYEHKADHEASDASHSSEEAEEGIDVHAAWNRTAIRNRVILKISLSGFLFNCATQINKLTLRSQKWKQ